MVIFYDLLNISAINAYSVYEVNSLNTKNSKTALKESLKNLNSDLP